MGVEMRRFIFKLLRRRHRDFGLIELRRGTSAVGNATSVIRFQGHTWSLTPAGTHRSRSADDVVDIHEDLIDAMRYGVIVPTVKSE